MRYYFSVECIYRLFKVWGGYLKVLEVKKIIRVIFFRFFIKYFFYNKIIEKGLNICCFGMKYIIFYFVLL